MKKQTTFFLFLFLLAFSFLFFNDQKIQAKTYDECYNEYSSCYNDVPVDGDTSECESALQACESSASDSGDYEQTGTDCSSRPGTVAENGECVIEDSNGWTKLTCEQQPNSEWLNNECVDKVATDCSQYKGTVNNSDGDCVPADNETDCNNTGGYWNGGCYESKDVFCSETIGNGYTWSSFSGKCVGGGSSECNPQSSDDPCGSGCACKPDSSSSLGGSCQQSTWGKMTGGCKSASSDTKTSGGGSGKTSNAVIKITNDGTVKTSTGTVAVKSGDTISSSGTILDSLGNAKGTISSSDLSSLVSSIGTGSSTLSNIASLVTGNKGGSKSGGTGLPGSYTFSSGGASAPKCAANFTEIGGVCFPTNTGLANPQGGITQIISNLFSWLMGLFTTIAVLAFVISGIQYLTSVGDDKQAETAKKNARYAIYGIIIGLSGFIIIKAIAAALAGSTYMF